MKKTHKPVLFLAAAAFLALGACGKGRAPASPGASSAPTGWQATDACAVLDKATVASVLGAEVTSAELGAVKAEGGGFDLYSQCVYKLADERMLVFGTGQATNGAGLADQVKSMRAQSAIVSDTPPEDLPGIGKAALWAPKLHALYVFLGDGRFVSATLSQFSFGKPALPIEKIQADELALVRKVGG